MVKKTIKVEISLELRGLNEKISKFNKFDVFNSYLIFIYLIHCQLKLLYENLWIF
jgi:hypothetical protein